MMPRIREKIEPYLSKKNFLLGKKMGNNGKDRAIFRLNLRWNRRFCRLKIDPGRKSYAA